MPLDDVTEDKAGAEAGNVGQQAAPEVTPATESTEQANTQASAEAQAIKEWKFGGNSYKSPDDLHRAALKWEQEITKKNQERAARDKEYTHKMGQYEAVVKAVQSDPALVQQVLAKMQAGMTQQQAVASTARQNQLDPAVAARIEALEGKEQQREMDVAIDRFFDKHKDISTEEDDAMESYLKENEEWLSQLPPERQLALAYAEVVAPKRSASLVQLGQKQKADEVQNGKKSAFLGSQAPTAGAKANGMPQRKRHMSPAEERAYAKAVWDRNAAKK